MCDDFYELTEDELEDDSLWRETFESLADERDRPKIVVVNYRKYSEVNNLIEKINFLLVINATPYTIKFKRNSFFYDRLSVVVVLSHFDIGPDVFSEYQKIIDGTASMSHQPLSDGSLEIIFTFKDVFVEISEEE